jgi:DNA-binding protein YbaB
MMKQREITDQDNTAWTCVQAYAGLDSKTAEQATKLAEAEDGTVTVVCTPSGGAQTVRLELDKEWMEGVTDEELRDAIAAASPSN